MGATVLAEGASDVLDNVKSQGRRKNSVIIMAGWQKARKSGDGPSHFSRGTFAAAKRMFIGG
jgi:hypothetical protein